MKKVRKKKKHRKKATIRDTFWNERIKTQKVAYLSTFKCVWSFHIQLKSQFLMRHHRWKGDRNHFEWTIGGVLENQEHLRGFREKHLTELLATKVENGFHIYHHCWNSCNFSCFMKNLCKERGIDLIAKIYTSHWKYKHIVCFKFILFHKKVPQLLTAIRRETVQFQITVK